MRHSGKKPVLVHPLLSERPTGMGVAALGLRRLIVPDLAEAAPRLDSWFRSINDSAIFGPLRLLLRLLIAQLAPLFIRRRLLFTSHHAPLWRTGRHAIIVYDLIALHFPTQSRAQTAYYRRILPRVLRCASHVITISHTVAAELAERFPNTAAANAEVIPSYSSRLDAPTEAAAPLPQRRQRAVFAVVGMRYRHKNLDVVLRALEQIHAEGHHQVKLVIAGYRRGLWPELEAQKSASWLTCHEYASEEQIDALYRNALAIIYPSLDEGMGLPPLDAMAAGCPVICSDLPVLRETCGDAPFYFDPRDANALGKRLIAMLSAESDVGLEHRRTSGFQQIESFRAGPLRARWREFLEGVP